MSDPPTTDLLEFALGLADAADAVTLPHFRGHLEVLRKDDGSLVTLADREGEVLLRRLILERFPDHAILGEEEGLHAGADGAARWVLDPVEGRTTSRAASPCGRR